MRNSENVLLSHLTETESLDVLAAEGFGSPTSCEVLESELSREIVQWAIKTYFSSNRMVPISKQAILDAFNYNGEMDALGIEIDDETELDSIEWAIEDLRGSYAMKQANQFAKDLSYEVAEAHNPDRARVLARYVGKLHTISRSLASQRNRVTPDEAGVKEDYEARKHATRDFAGLSLGINAIDNHFDGVHPGELAVFAAASGDGKSFYACKVALAEWLRGRTCVLVTLENSVAMTAQRIVCMGAGVDLDSWMTGGASQREEERVESLLQRFRDSGNRPIITMPPEGERDVLSLTRQALTEDADSLIIDQLNFTEAPSSSNRDRPRWAAFSDTVRELKTLISDVHNSLPCLLLHQMKREGIERARKSGRYVMDDMGESTAVEQTADFVFALYRNPDRIAERMAIWQTLKARRASTLDLSLNWDLSCGDISFRSGGVD
jgi:replicative DNA helicase